MEAATRILEIENKVFIARQGLSIISPLIPYLEYRKVISEKILNATPLAVDGYRNSLIEMLDQTNEEIKKILGL